MYVGNKVAEPVRLQEHILEFFATFSYPGSTIFFDGGHHKEKAQRGKINAIVNTTFECGEWLNKILTNCPAFTQLLLRYPEDFTLTYIKATHLSWQLNSL